MLQTASNVPNNLLPTYPLVHLLQFVHVDVLDGHVCHLGLLRLPHLAEVPVRPQHHLHEVFHTLSTATYSWILK